MSYNYYLYSGSMPRMFPLFVKTPILFRVPTALAQDENASLEFWGLKRGLHWDWQFCSFKARLMNSSNETELFRQMSVTELIAEPITFTVNSDIPEAAFGYASLLQHLV